MPYIWEEYSSDKRFRIADRVCPYVEVFGNNQIDVEINPMLRFSEIIDRDTIGFDDSGDVQNIVFHYLAQLDRVKGLSYFQTVIENIRNEIIDGYWGETVGKVWKELSSHDQEIIVSVLAQRLLNDRKSFFMDVLGKLFPESSVCYEEKTDLYYLYIRAEENLYNAQLLTIVKVLFWNMNHNILTIWKEHYGIIGTDDTMHIERIQVV